MWEKRVFKMKMCIWLEYWKSVEYFLAYLSIILHIWKFLIIQIHLQAGRLNNYKFVNLEMLSACWTSAIYSSLHDNMKINRCVRQSTPHPYNAGRQCPVECVPEWSTGIQTSNRSCIRVWNTHTLLRTDT